MHMVSHADPTKRPHPSTDRTFPHHILAGDDRGQPLAPGVRHHLEPRFGHSFAAVRVHADHRADQLARGLGARAFTAEQDIYFREGTYDPASAQGLRLLAHELTHTIQQQGAAAAGPAIGSRSDPFEDEARAMADAVTAGPGGSSGDSVTTQAPPAIQCEEDDSGLGFLGTLLSGVASFGRAAIGDVPFAHPPAGGVGPLTATDAAAAGQASQAIGALNVVGGGINVAKGISGLANAEDAGDVISPLIGTVGGGMQLLGGGMAAAGLEGGLAALGPLGAAVALGGTLGGIAGEQLWEWDKQAHMGARTEDASDLGADFVPGEAYNPERSWLFDLLEGD